MAGKSGVFGKAMKDFMKIEEWSGALGKGILDSNAAINSVGDASKIAGKLTSGGAMSGIPRSIHNMRKGGQGFKEAVKGAHSLAEGGLDHFAIAGSAMTAAAAGRIVSGGGLTKDSKGRSNVIGVPFI